MEKWVLARRRSQLFLRNKAAHADMGSREGMRRKRKKKSMPIKRSPSRLPPTTKRKREAKTGWKKRRAGTRCCLWLHGERQ